MVRRDVLSVPTSLLSRPGSGVGSQALGAPPTPPRLTRGAAGKGGSRPLYLEWTCLYVGVSRTPLAADKLQTAASAACGARPAACVASIVTR